MNDAKKNENEREDSAAVKKQSKHFLAVYIIGLFSVALVLILLSYLTQERADQQLQQLSSQLNEQTSEAQGAQRRIQTLQSTVEEQQQQIYIQSEIIDSLLELTGQTEKETLAAAVETLKEQNAALGLLLDALAAEEENPEESARLAAQIEQTYGEKLNSLLSAHAMGQYQALRERLGG